MDIRQSPPYARFVEKIGWQVYKIGQAQIFVKKIPLLGNFAKLQRPEKVPTAAVMKTFYLKKRPFRLLVEPLKERRFPEKDRPASPYSPTRTLLINLRPKEKEIFRSFAESKRRAIRRAEKNKILIKISQEIEGFVELKTRDFFPLGFFYRREILALWESFFPQNAQLLLAYENGQKKPIAGILLLFWQKTAYYWLAASSQKGKAFSAPALLVWEALKTSKKHGCRIFDFEGLDDPRFPKETKSWRGFSKFKQGFGGKIHDFGRPFYWK